VKFFKIIKLAAVYLIRYRRRYFFLFLALIFGFGIVTVITSVKDGMYENVYVTSQSHYAGDIVVMGFDRDSRQTHHIGSGEMAAVYRAAEAADLHPDRIVLRTHFGEKGVLYYNGSALRLKYVIGVDWEAEAPFFNNLDYAEPPSAPLSGDGGMILSAPVARVLGIRTGDELVLEGETWSGQKNTASFIVSAIVNDATIFGYYKVYISRHALNALVGYGADECSYMGFYFSDRRGVEEKKGRLQAELSKIAQTAPMPKDRTEFDRETGQSWNGVKLFVLSIPVYLSEVADLLGAMDILTYFLYVMMLLIILVSASVTYRLILHERMRELGTMRVIGFYEADVVRVLMLETLGLGILSLAGGFLAARLINWGLGFLSFSWFPSFEIFLKGGRLTALYLPRTMAVNTAALFCMLAAAVFFPAWRSVRIPLSKMLSGGQ
jgi:putative ABC transport system permease protein